MSSGLISQLNAENAWLTQEVSILRQQLRRSEERVLELEQQRSVARGAAPAPARPSTLSLFVEHGQVMVRSRSSSTDVPLTDFVARRS
jgi:hypothetical protein